MVFTHNFTFLVIIYYFDFVRISFTPLKTNTPFVINPNAVLFLPIYYLSIFPAYLMGGTFKSFNVSALFSIRSLLKVLFSPFLAISHNKQSQ